MRITPAIPEMLSKVPAAQSQAGMHPKLDNKLMKTKYALHFKAMLILNRLYCFHFSMIYSGRTSTVVPNYKERLQQPPSHLKIQI